MIKLFFLWSYYDFYDIYPNYNNSHILISIYDENKKDYVYQRSIIASSVFKYLYGGNWFKMIEHQYPSNSAVLKLTNIEIDDLLNL